MQSAQEMTDKPHIIADCDIPFLKGVLEPYADMEYLKGSEISPADALRADALIIRTRTRCDGRLLDGTPVRLIATATIGHDHIDSPYCREHRIEIRTAAGCNARGVLQYVMAALAALARRDGWTPAGRTLGVVGVGSVGSLIAQYGERFGFRVLRCDPPKAKQDPAGDYTELNEMLPQCDIVTCHVPLSVNGDYPTKAMADASFFASMKPGAVFVNTSRGGIVVDEDLIEARRSGRLSHTVIDTWNDEPHISRDLLGLASLATPHIAGYTVQGKAAGTAAAVRAVSRHYSMPLDDWYPPQVTPGKPDPSIGWERMSSAMPRYFDIEAETSRLRAHPELFETMRNNYRYRNEFF